MEQDPNQDKLPIIGSNISDEPQPNNDDDNSDKQSTGPSKLD